MMARLFEHLYGYPQLVHDWTRTAPSPHPRSRCPARPAWSSVQIGVHGSTPAIFIAVEVLDQVGAWVPATVCSLVVFALVALRGTWFTRR